MNYKRALNCRQSELAITHRLEHREPKVSVVKPAACRLACVIMGIRKGALLKGNINVQKSQTCHQGAQPNPSNDQGAQAGSFYLAR
jgi:hypothetical protein